MLGYNETVGKDIEYIDDIFFKQKISGTNSFVATF
jgi:hypothetical protein